jgi:hypothetical protein
MALHMGCCVNTVRKSLKSLKLKGVIYRTEKYCRKLNKPNYYKVVRRFKLFLEEKLNIKNKDLYHGNNEDLYHEVGVIKNNSIKTNHLDDFNFKENLSTAQINKLINDHGQDLFTSEIERLNTIKLPRINNCFSYLKSCLKNKKLFKNDSRATDLWNKVVLAGRYNTPDYNKIEMKVIDSMPDRNFFILNSYNKKITLSVIEKKFKELS